MSALSFAEVSAGYGARPALTEVSAGFPEGAVTGLVGPNGAGKTTLLRVALRLLARSGGGVSVFGRALESFSRDALARTMAYLPQGAEAHWPVIARRIVALGRLPHRAPLAQISEPDSAAIDSALVRCDALALADRRMDELSAGERARVLLARALATEAPILLVDEPAAHLDPAHQLRLMELLSEEARRGAAVIVTLHDLALASRFCDRLVLLKSGRVAASGPAADALSDAALAEVFGISAVRAGQEIHGAGAPAVVPWQRI